MQKSKTDALVQQAALAFLEHCPFGVIVFDRSLTILEVNKQQEVNSGVDRKRFVDKRLDEVFAAVFQRYGLQDTMQKLVQEKIGRAHV